LNFANPQRTVTVTTRTAGTTFRLRYAVYGTVPAQIKPRLWRT